MMRSIAWRLSRGLWWFMETTDTRLNHLLYPLYCRLVFYADGPDDEPQQNEPREGSR